MPFVFVSIGSNIDRENNIRGAVRALRCRYRLRTLSTVYETEPVGFSGNNFFNLVTAFDTDIPLAQLKAGLDEIEAQFGRRRDNQDVGARTLDLDLLLYGDLIQHDACFDIPRKEILEHAFVLRPLAEIAPDVRHPETGRTFADMWRDFPKEQKLWPVPLDTNT